MPPAEKLILSYLRRISKLASKSPNRTIQVYTASKSLKLDDSTSADVETILNTRGWIRESTELAGTIEVTTEGAQALKNEKWWIKYPQKLKDIFRKLNTIGDFKKRLFHALILFLLYEVFEAFINSHLNEL